MYEYSEHQSNNILKMPHLQDVTICCFVFKILEQAVVSAKCVITKEKLHKQLTGQNTTPYISLKTHPSEKWKSVKFDEFKLLDNQTEKVAEVIDKMNTGPPGRQNQQNRPYKFYIHRDRSRGHNNYPSFNNGYDRCRGSFRQRSYDRNRRWGTLHWEADPEVIIIQGDHAEDKKTIEIEVTLHSNGSEVNLDHQLKDLKLFQGLPKEIKIDVSGADSLFIFVKECPVKTHLQENCSIERSDYLSKKEVQALMKEIQQKREMKKLWQQCVTVVKLTVSSK